MLAQTIQMHAYRFHPFGRMSWGVGPPGATGQIHAYDNPVALRVSCLRFP